MSVRRFRYLIFLKDVLALSLTAFGGPQAHIAFFQKRLVERRGYITEHELNELNAICQVLPGPTSTQTLSAIGYRLGGARLAYLTLLVWSLPSVAIMTTAGILIGHYEARTLQLEFTRYLQPIAVGFVAYAAWSIIRKTVSTKAGFGIMAGAALGAFFIRSPWVFPVILLVAGGLTAFKFRAQPKEARRPGDIRWSNFWLWAGVLVLAAILGGLTHFLPVKLFENFYRNGSLVFGGGQVLTPMLYTEFVQYAKPVAEGLARPYVNTAEFLSGLALVQVVPGPLFSFSAYLGALAMHSRGFGVAGEITGGLFSAAGIFLPGTFLIFFMIRVWERLKSYRPIRASLEGISAANAGLVAAAALLLFLPLDKTLLNFGFTAGTFCVLAFTRIPSWLLIPLGLLLGLIFRPS